METTDNLPTMDGFNKSLEELLRFADCFKLREKELEQEYQLQIEKQKAEYDIQIQLEKRRTEQLQEINRKLTEQLAQDTQKQVDFDQKYTVILLHNSSNYHYRISLLRFYSPNTIVLLKNVNRSKNNIMRKNFVLKNWKRLFEYSIRIKPNSMKKSNN